MKLSATLLSGIVHATPGAVDIRKLARLEAGQVVEVVNGNRYRIASRTLSSDGGTFRLQTPTQTFTVTASELIDMGPLPATLTRLAHVLRLYAFNKDLDAYVKEAIKAHGLPVDEKMNWAKWFYAKFAPALLKQKGPKSEEVVDEVLHHFIIDVVYEKDVLANYKAKKQPGDNLDPARKVSVYLSRMFNEYKSYALRTYQQLTQVVPDALGKTDKGNYTGLHKDLSTPMVVPSGLYEEDAEVNLLDTEAHSVPSHGPDVESREDLNRFRNAFVTWVKKRYREETADSVEKLLDIIIAKEEETGSGPGTKREDYITDWMEATGKSFASFKVVMAKTEELLSEFVKKNPEMADISQLGQLINDINEKKPTTKRKVDGVIPTPVAASLNLVAAAPSDLAGIRENDTGTIPHVPPGRGGTDNGVIIVDEPPLEQPRRTVTPEYPAVKHGTN